MFSIPQHQSTAPRSLLQLSAPQPKTTMRKEQPYHQHIATPRPQKPTGTLRTLLGSPFTQQQQQPTRQMTTPQLPSSSSRPVRDRKQTPKAAVLVENQKEIVAATSHAATLMKKRTPILNQRRISTSYMGGIRPPTALLHTTPRMSLPSSIPSSMDDSIEVIELDSPSPPSGTKAKARCSCNQNSSSKILLSSRMPMPPPSSLTMEQKVHDTIAARLAALQKQTPAHPAVRTTPIQKRYNQPATSFYSIKPPSNGLPGLKMTIQKAVVPRLTENQIAATLNRVHNPFVPSSSAQKKQIARLPLPSDDLGQANAQQAEAAQGETPAHIHPKKIRVSKKKKEAAVTPPPSAPVEEDAVASPMDWLMAMVEQAIPVPAPAAVHTSNSDDEENVDVMAPLLQEEITPAKKVAKKRRRAPATPVNDAIQLDTPPSSEKKRRLAPTIHIDAVCANCGTRETSQWRRLGEGSEVECNPCSLYFKKRGHARPAELNREIQRRCRKSDGAEENNNNVPKRRYRKSEKVVVLDLESALEAIVPRQNYDDDGSS
ncbi:hypothetical protein PRIPAC_83367 [Pristionchus pacificus]|uniref:GATA-type domain-containing protein n=1 Tax=Pristionchus pacificus TaxID=54126 RepID=A0A2A6BLT8_PRIPA|nr:hypothetical protein PRIPAC_83367 [Pristionchus pacificus]|eukprot:PDM66867.1 hypothetical protein PRIPAC_48284 [Pristionchus pacificus]